MLVTSRRHLGDLPGAAGPVLLEVLPPDEAQEMFVRLAPRAATGPAGAVAELVRLAGYLPLAISLLARVYARHPSWTLADLTAETRASLLTLTAENDSVAAAFEVSYRYLDPGQQHFFRCLGLHPGTTIDAYAAAALAGIACAEAAAQLDALHGEGLLTETGYRRYGMHDLIRRYAPDRAAADPAGDRDQALERLLDYYQHTAALAEARLARQARTSRARRCLAASAAVPDLPDTHPGAGVGTGRTRQPARLPRPRHPTGQHARVVALTAAMATLLRQTAPGPTPSPAMPPPSRPHGTSATGQVEATALNDLGDVRRLTGDYPGAPPKHWKQALRHLPRPRRPARPGQRPDRPGEPYGG